MSEKQQKPGLPAQADSGKMSPLPDSDTDVNSSSHRSTGGSVRRRFAFGAVLIFGAVICLCVVLAPLLSELPKSVLMLGLAAYAVVFFASLPWFETELPRDPFA